MDPQRQKLWLSIYLPQLPLEIFLQKETSFDPALNRPIAVTQNQRITTLSQAAAITGLKIGTFSSQAYALCDNLTCIDRDIQREQHALNHIAQWLYQFTPNIGLHGGQHLILEVSTSLALFSGFKNLKTRIHDRLNALGYTAVLGASQTPMAAKISAAFNLPDNHQSPPIVTLGDRELDELMFPQEAILKLASMGITTLNQLLKLPRAGISKRFGQSFVKHIDLLLGDQPDPQTFITAALNFDERLFFLDPIENLQSLIFPLKRLLKNLSSFLTTHQQYLQHFTAKLCYRGKSQATLSIHLAAPDNDLSLFLMLTDIKLTQVKAASEIDEIILSATQFKPATPQAKILFESMPPSYSAESLQDHRLHPHRDSTQTKRTHDLLNLLQTRLPAKTCFGLSLNNEHRPEKHASSVDLTEVPKPPPATLTPDWPTRPLFLFHHPQRLNKTIDPLQHPDFEKLRGPERINASWWDGDGQNRDYYICRYKQRAIYWLFYRPLTHRWYLHGLFS